MLMRFGVNKLLFLKGDCCVGGQLRPDVPADFQEFRKARHLGELCAVTNYPEVYNSSASARSERVCAKVRQVLSCPYSLTQFFNVSELFAKASVRACMLTRL